MQEIEVKLGDISIDKVVENFKLIDFMVHYSQVKVDEGTFELFVIAGSAFVSGHVQLPLFWCLVYCNAQLLYVSTYLI